MRRVWITAREHSVRTGVRRVAILVPGVVGLLTAAVMSATAATAPPPSTLSANGVLSYPNYLQSPDGHFHLVMSSNGNLAETIPGDRTLWSTGTSKYPGARAVMQVNGNLVIYDPTNTAVWSSNSPTVGCPRLVLQNDGNLVIYGNTASSWSAQSALNKMLKGDVLKSGWSLYSKAPGGLPADHARRRQPGAVRRLGHRAVVDEDLRPCRRLRLDADRRQPRRLRQDGARAVVKRHQRPPRLPPGDARRRQRRHHRPRGHRHLAQQHLPQGLRACRWRPGHRRR